MARDVSTTLPELTWPNGAIITVQPVDAGAAITAFVIHGYQDGPTPDAPVPPPPLLSHDPPETGDVA